MHNGTIMQFLFRLFGNILVQCFWLPENAGHSKNLSLFDKKQAQTELTNVWHSTLIGSWQKLVSSMSNFTASFRQTSGQAGGKAVF